MIVRFVRLMHPGYRRNLKARLRMPRSERKTYRELNEAERMMRGYFARLVHPSYKRSLDGVPVLIRGGRNPIARRAAGRRG